MQARGIYSILLAMIRLRLLLNAIAVQNVQDNNDKIYF